MNRAVGIALTILVILGVAYAATSFGKTVIKENIGDLGPAFGPTGETPPQAAGEKADTRITVPENFTVTIFSKETPGARDLQFSPDGTLLVSLRTQGKVVALPDKNSDGKADSVITVLSGLNNPHGLAFYEGQLFVAEERHVSRYNWDESTSAAELDKKIVDLPAGGAGHVTRSLIFDSKGNLFVSIGSTCNTCDEKDDRNGSVLITNKDGSNPRIYSSGLRNAVFLTLKPGTDSVWVSENSRDRLGDDLPPDEINILQDGKDFGWPYCYGQNVLDKTFGGKDQAYCNTTIAPAGEVPAHSAALGLEFIQSSQFPEDWQGDLLVAFHGSWNRSVPTGYKVVKLDVENDKVVNQTDFMSGFLQNGQALGRPVDVTFDKNGSLYVSDDKAGTVFLITTKQ